MGVFQVPAKSELTPIVQRDPHPSPPHKGEGEKQKSARRSNQSLLDRLADVAAEVGQSGFHRKLRDAIAAHVKADLSMVMRYSVEGAPEYLTNDGLNPEHMGLYLNGLYRVDPVYRVCRDGVSSGVLDLHEISAPIDEEGNYFDIFLRMTGMTDDMTILLPLPDAAATLGLVFERKARFRKPELAEMKSVYPLIDSLHRLHLKFSSDTGAGKEFRRAPPPGLPPLSYGTALDSFLRGKLTPRERDIMRLILLGYPNAKTAELLELTVHTIKNHKKRMYKKLDITTERELFLNFITSVFEQTKAE